MGHVVGALGSGHVSAKSFGRNRGGPAVRGPKGKRHAIDLDTGDPACGTPDALRIFEDWPWEPDGDWCAACEAAIPFE